MPSTTRRRVLGLVTTAGVSGLAGCNAVEESPASRLGELSVANHDTREHRVHLVLLESGDSVYWRSKRVSAATEDELGGAVFEGYPTDSGEYELHVRRDGDPRSEWAAFDFADHDAPCLGLSVQIGDTTDERTGEVSVWYTTNPRVCEAETADAEGETMEGSGVSESTNAS